MTVATIQALLKDHEQEVMRDRRSVRRKPFVRPMQIASGRHRNEIYEAFSRDISHVGLGTVSRVEWPRNTIATLTVHSLNKQALTFDAQARWNEQFGSEWFLTGWTFLDR